MDPYHYLDSLNKFGSEGGFKPGLERMAALLSEFDHPENKLNVIHVAGTNGKGSTIAFLKNIYQKAGLKVGVFTSPPLFEFNERILINNKQISTSELRDLLNDIIPVVEKITQNRNLGQPSFFEVATLIAFLYFYRSQIDLVLLEVGLGGRLDATNIVKSPLVSIITNISLEHTAILGDSVAEIAREKAGIIKENTPVITSVRKSEALREIKKKVKYYDNKWIQLDQKYNYEIIDETLTGQYFQVSGADLELKLKIKLLGQHQIRNAVLALTVVEELQEQFSVTVNDIKTGLVETDWPGRLEIVRKTPTVLLDGAHNEAGFLELITFLKKQVDLSQTIYFILSILKDKNIKSMINLLKFRDDNLEIIITQNKTKRAASPDTIKNIVNQKKLVNKSYDSIFTAITEVLNQAQTQDVIVITGSLYTVGEARQYFAKIKH